MSRAFYPGPIVDAHTHPMIGPTPILGGVPHTADDYLRSVRGWDVRHVAALTIAFAGRPVETRRANDAILALPKSTGGRFFPVCSVHPDDGAAALEEIDRVAALGAKALKLHPNTQRVDVASPAVHAVVARATERGLPVLFDAYSPFDPGQPGKFVLLAIEQPTARLILAHAHGPHFPDLLMYDVLARYDFWKRNVWVDLSATVRLLSGGPFAAQFLWTVRKVGVDRLLFGSDYPLDPAAPAAEAVARLGFTRAELARVFYRNAAELFGLATPLPRRARPKPKRRT